MAPSYPFKRPEPARRSLTAAELNGSKVASGPTLKPSNSTEPIQKPSSRPEPARRSLTAAELAGFSGLPVHSFLRLRFLSASPDRVVATLVSSRQSAQPFGNLHGGVSALITEAVGSLGAAVAAGGAVVGVEVACSHLRPAPIGTPVVAVGTPLRVGRTVQVWEVRLSVGRESDLVQGEETSLNVKVQNGTGETSSASELRGTESPEGRSAGPGPGQLPALESPDRKRGGSRPGHPLALEHRETKRGGPRAGQLLAVGRLTCVPLPQGHAMGENGGRSGEGEEEGHRNGRREGGLEKAGEEGGEGREEEQGSREEGREGSLARMLHSELELEPAQVNTAVFDTPRFNSLPIHKFLGLRFLVASPRRVVATFISSPASAQPFNNVHGGVSALITESLGSVGASLAAGGAVAGVEVTTSHLRPCRLNTPVLAVAIPLRVGRTVQVWEVRLSVGEQEEQAHNDDLWHDEQRQGKEPSHTRDPSQTRDPSEASAPHVLRSAAPKAGLLLAVGRLTVVPLPNGARDEKSKSRL